MTEFEINKAVAEKLGISHKCDMGTVIIHGDSGCKSFDPCNNIEQAWEIMMKYNICVTKEPGGGYAALEGLVASSVDNADWIYDAWHKNP